MQTTQRCIYACPLKTYREQCFCALTMTMLLIRTPCSAQSAQTPRIAADGGILP